MIAFSAVFAAERPRICLELVTSDNLAQSAKALDDGELDFLIARADVATPAKGRSVAILRRDAIVLIIPAGSSIGQISDLRGKTVGIPHEPLAPYNERLLDRLLEFYSIPPTAVSRLVLSPHELGRAMQQQRISAVFAVGSVADGPVLGTIGSISRYTKAAPGIVNLEEAEAISKDFPLLESFEVARGSFQGNPPIPDETITTVATTVRLLARSSESKIFVSEIARVLISQKANLVALMPAARDIEAPDTEDKSSPLPVHPGAADYFNGKETDLFERLRDIFYILLTGLGVVGSAATWLSSRLRKPKPHPAQEKISGLIALIREIPSADTQRLARLEDCVDTDADWSIERRASGDISSDVYSVFAAAVARAREAISRRRGLINTRQQPHS